MMAGYCCCQNDHGSDHPMPGYAAGAAIPSHGNLADSRNIRTARRTRSLDSGFATSPRNCRDWARTVRQRRVFLTARVRIVTNRLQGDHGGNCNVVFPKLSRINNATHIVRLEEWRLLVDETYQTQRLPQLAPAVGARAPAPPLHRCRCHLPQQHRRPSHSANPQRPLLRRRRRAGSLQGY
jgi:hypothetical protein